MRYSDMRRSQEYIKVYLVGISCFFMVFLPVMALVAAIISFHRMIPLSTQRKNLVRILTINTSMFIVCHSCFSRWFCLWSFLIFFHVFFKLGLVKEYPLRTVITKKYTSCVFMDNILVSFQIIWISMILVQHCAFVSTDWRKYAVCVKL